MNHCEHFVSSEPGPDGHLEYCSTEVISTAVLVTRMAYSQGKNYSQSGARVPRETRRAAGAGMVRAAAGQTAGSWGGKDEGKGKASSTSSGTVRRNLSGRELSHPTKGASKLSTTDH